MGLASTSSIFRLEQGRKIGEGTFVSQCTGGYWLQLMVYQGLAYHARERVTGRVVALKKSRVSLRVKRTTLEYEANILHLLAGHPSIPTIFAFGRLAHFEYIAIELLGPSLNDVLKEQGRFYLKSVLQIADQMVRHFLANS
jgi:serine/threonine protein kinase